MCKKAVLIMTSVLLLVIVTLSFSQDRIQRKPIPQQVPADKLQPKQPAQPGPSSAPERKDTKSACPKLGFVTPSPLPSTGLGWDYKCQIQASGGFPPLIFCSMAVGFQGIELPSLDIGIPGLKITTSGLIQGQPEQAGYYVIRILLRDSCPSGVQRIEKKFALEVKGPTK